MTCLKWVTDLKASYSKHFLEKLLTSISLLVLECNTYFV